MALVRSLRARVVLWVCVALVVLFAATITGLDIAFRNSTDRDRRELLEAQVLGLIALAEPGPAGELRLPTEAIDPRFEVANSGLYGALYDSNGRALWQSLSLLGRDFPTDELAAPGERRPGREVQLSGRRGHVALPAVTPRPHAPSGHPTAHSHEGAASARPSLTWREISPAMKWSRMSTRHPDTPGSASTRRRTSRPMSTANTDGHSGEVRW